MCFGRGELHFDLACNKRAYFGGENAAFTCRIMNTSSGKIKGTLSLERVLTLMIPPSGCEKSHCAAELA